MGQDFSRFENIVVMRNDEVESVEPGRLKLYLFRYVDNVANGEFVNLAIALVEESAAIDRFVGFSVMEDWVRLKAFFPNADVENLKSWCAFLSDEIQRTKVSAELSVTLENASTNIEVTVQSQGVLSLKSPEDEMKSLAGLYLH